MDNSLVPLQKVSLIRSSLVLILVVMDNSLVLGSTISVSIERYEVLILVVMDNSLVRVLVCLFTPKIVSLNPCCNGQ